VWVNYFVTSGKMDNDTIVLFDPRNGRVPGSSDGLFAPQAPGDYVFWAVVRDDRGGASWVSMPLHAQ
jgi:hypothetical protein